MCLIKCQRDFFFTLESGLLYCIFAGSKGQFELSAKVKDNILTD